MSGQHTPGPWFAEITAIGWRVWPGKGDAICTGMIPVWAACDPEDSQGERARQHANAKLMAAAPDLLAACRDLVAAADRTALEANSGAADAAIDAAKAAIAKAEGRT